MKTKALYILIIAVCLSAGHAARFSWERYDDKPLDWFAAPEAVRMADHLLTWQDDQGGWPKNVDTGAEPFAGDRKDLQGTFDNGATTGEMQFLAHAYRATKNSRYLEAFNKTLDLILKAQYPTGGWPQRYPPGKGYDRHITFNDGAMVRLMELLKEVAGDPNYDFVDPAQRTAAKQAFDRGIECILKCQIQVNGKRTVWCAQHDEVDYRPRPARSYELVSLSGGESVGILRLLMSIDPPTPEIIEAIKAGAQWYQDAKVKGIRVTRVDGKVQAVQDPDAPVLWARFYEIGSNRPFFCNRDGVPTYDFNEVDQERLTGYAWYGNWGQDVFKAYQAWSTQWQGLLKPAGKKMLAIIGDSTVCEFPEGDNRRGWGQYIHEYMDDSVVVLNKARSGRSTKTFIQQGLWKEVLDQNPAWVLIQFGHNDSHAPENPESTDADTDYADYLRRYVDETRAAGAVPVLITPMHRRKFDDEGKLKDTLLPYANAMKKVALEKKVALVDLHTASGELFLKLGPAGSAEMANAADDQTHFNEKGARAMADLVMQQLTQVEPSLKSCIK